MSHVAAIELEVTDLDALKQAIGDIPELEYMEGQKTFRWYGRWINDYASDDAAYKNGINPKDYGKCLHAIRMKNNAGAYEIGVCQLGTKVIDGKEVPRYALAFDFFAQSNNITRIAGGKDLPKIKQLYAAHTGVKSAIKAGWKNVKLEWHAKTKLPFVTGVRP